jgi:hypothetical protein
MIHVRMRGQATEKSKTYQYAIAGEGQTREVDLVKDRLSLHGGELATDCTYKDKHQSISLKRRWASHHSKSSKSRLVRVCFPVELSRSLT